MGNIYEDFLLNHKRIKLRIYSYGGSNNLEYAFFSFNKFLLIQ
jgi:hypothetical protein